MGRHELSSISANRGQRSARGHEGFPEERTSDVSVERMRRQSPRNGGGVARGERKKGVVRGRAPPTKGTKAPNDTGIFVPFTAKSGMMPGTR